MGNILWFWTRRIGGGQARSPQWRSDAWLRAHSAGSQAGVLASQPLALDSLAVLGQVTSCLSACISSAGWSPLITVGRSRHWLAAIRPRSSALFTHPAPFSFSWFCVRFSILVQAEKRVSFSCHPVGHVEPRRGEEWCHSATLPCSVGETLCSDDSRVWAVAGTCRVWFYWSDDVCGRL